MTRIHLLLLGVLVLSALLLVRTTYDARRLARELGACGGTNHVRDDTALCGLLDAEVAVLEEAAQAALEDSVLRVGDDETLGGHGGSCWVTAMSRHGETRC